MKTMKNSKILLLTFIALFSSQSWSTFAHDIEVVKPPILSISGEGQEIVIPDVGELTLGLEADSKSASEAQTKASAILTSFIGQLKGIGILPNEIKTVESSLEPVRDYNSKPPHKILSYRAVQKIRIRIIGEDRLKLISKAIDSAAVNSINRIESINFSVSPERAKTAEKKALSLASNNALQSAKEVLNSMGLKFVRVKEINLQANQNSYMVQNIAMRSTKEAYADGAAQAPEITNIMPGELAVKGNANLLVEFE